MYCCFHNIVVTIAITTNCSYEFHTLCIDSTSLVYYCATLHSPCYKSTIVTLGNH